MKGVGWDAAREHVFFHHPRLDRKESVEECTREKVGVINTREGDLSRAEDGLQIAPKLVHETTCLGIRGEMRQDLTAKQATGFTDIDVRIARNGFIIHQKLLAGRVMGQETAGVEE
jgi:hypothetical protein